MVIDWMIVATIAAPVIALFVGVALDRLLERKPKLIAYFLHASVFRLAAPNLTIHAHGIVIKNTGRRPANDIRVRHNILPDFHVFPNIQYQVQTLPGGGAEIVFPILVPEEQVSISYLYFPPTLYSQIHAGIRHSHGFAREVTVLPTPQLSAWIRRTLWSLVVVGAIFVLYILFEFGHYAFARWFTT
jgi:hypothetical protein